MSVYVEILVRAPMDALWAHSQTPALHERWDLRFSRSRPFSRIRVWSRSSLPGTSTSSRCSETPASRQTSRRPLESRPW